MFYCDSSLSYRHNPLYFPDKTDYCTKRLYSSTHYITLLFAPGTEGWCAAQTKASAPAIIRTCPASKHRELLTVLPGQNGQAEPINQSERCYFNTTANFNSLNISNNSINLNSSNSSDNSINLDSSNSSDNSINLNGFSHSNRGHSNRNPILTYFRVLCNYLHLCFLYPFHAPLYINNCYFYLSA